MKLLALECSAAPASCAVWEDGRILSEFYINVKLTHSQTLMPMVECMLRSTGLSPADLDGFAVSAGPGSFTGVRIGTAALAGMAWPLDKPCAPVSTLEAMAENLRGGSPLQPAAPAGQEAEGLQPTGGPPGPQTDDALLCCVMDARCSQVYNALFQRQDGQIHRLCPDRALMIDQLGDELEQRLQQDSDQSPCTYSCQGLPVLLAGDGAELCYQKLSGRFPGLRLAPEPLRFQRASGVAAAAERMFAAGQVLPAEELRPIYLRLPQAERDLKKKQAAQG